MKKDVVKVVLLTAAVYICVPLMNLWFPMTRRYTFLLDLWLLNPVVAAAGPFGFCMRYGAAVVVRAHSGSFVCACGAHFL